MDSSPFSGMFGRETNPVIKTGQTEWTPEKQEQINNDYATGLVNTLNSLQGTIDPTGVFTGNTAADPSLIGKASDYYGTTPGMAPVLGAKMATDYISSIFSNALNQVNRIGSDNPGEIPIYDPGVEYVDVFKNAGYSDNEAMMLSIAASGIEPGASEMATLTQLATGLAAFGTVARAMRQLPNPAGTIQDLVRYTDEIDDVLDSGGSVDELMVSVPEIAEVIKSTDKAPINTRASRSELGSMIVNRLAGENPTPQSAQGFMNAMYTLTGENPDFDISKARTDIQSNIGDFALMMTDMTEPLRDGALNRVFPVDALRYNPDNIVMLDSLNKIADGKNGSKEVESIFDIADNTQTTIVTQPSAFEPSALIRSLQNAGASSKEIDDYLASLPNTDELMLLYNRLYGFEPIEPGSMFFVRYPKPLEKEARKAFYVPKLKIENEQVMVRGTDGVWYNYDDPSWYEDLEGSYISREDSSSQLSGGYIVGSELDENADAQDNLVIETDLEQVPSNPNPLDPISKEFSYLESLTGMNKDEFIQWANRVGWERAKSALRANDLHTLANSPSLIMNQ